MLCIEILQGDKVICRAGHEDAVLLTATLHLLLNPKFQRLIVSGSVDQSSSSEHCQWLDVSLLQNEILSLRIVDRESADEPVNVKRFGTFPDEEGKKYYCSFCGADAEKQAKLMVGVNANICSQCVQAFIQWATNEKPQNA